MLVDGASTIDKLKYRTLDDFTPGAELGRHRWSAQISPDRSFEAVGLNKGSDVLIVSLHGATDRKKYIPPRFERFTTLSSTPYSNLFFGDPTLSLSKELELGWYTGWRGFNGHFWVAEWSRRVAAAYGASKVVFCGSSGGGMASLQASSYVPGSMALAFNPQTSVSRYLVAGERDHAQRRYSESVFPELVPNGWASRDRSIDWTCPLGELTSAVMRYESPLANYVYYVQNINDYFHVRDHLTPFQKTVEESLPAKHVERRFRFEEYDGPRTHAVPDRETYLYFLGKAITWQISSECGI